MVRAQSSAAAHAGAESNPLGELLLVREPELKEGDVAAQEGNLVAIEIVYRHLEIQRAAATCERSDVSTEERVTDRTADEKAVSIQRAAVGAGTPDQGR